VTIARTTKAVNTESHRAIAARLKELGLRLADRDIDQLVTVSRVFAVWRRIHAEAVLGSTMPNYIQPVQGDANRCRKMSRSGRSLK
jgi:hypothetical protein